MSIVQSGLLTGSTHSFVAVPHGGAPFAPAQPVMTSDAGRIGPGYVKLHVPFEPVVHVPLVPGGGVRVTVKCTVTPFTGMPQLSSTVAVTVWLVPTSFVAAAGLSVTVVTTPQVGGAMLDAGPSSEK
jgi:hypothetical protein